MHSKIKTIIFTIFINLIFMYIFIFLSTSFYIYWKTPQVELEGTSIISFDKEIGFIPTSEMDSTFICCYNRPKEHHYTTRFFSDKNGARTSKPNQRTSQNSEIGYFGGSFTWGHGIQNEHIRRP